jgi:hypothetical protein
MAELSDQEYNAGVAAAVAKIDEVVPGWERGMIPDEAIQALVHEVVNAVDAVRQAQSQSQVAANLPHVEASSVPKDT